MDETEKDRQHLGLEEQCAPDLTGHRFPIAVHVADMPDDLGKLLDIGSRSISVAADVNSYDAWFRAKVQAALEEECTGTSQVQVMQAAQALIDAKREVEPKS
ncbi:antitoxin PaaA2 family protein [Roseovarius atlanticus]|uniref:antitoxin PaaA2 family protein n=1 Tax=Roseovarius atlanticus TaxID=1641875 RepID=UPI001F351313|nr:hypothetical protein [Roseovarius atlanticus]